ncbi:MAG: hypothetical protein ABIB79_05430 [archaeon]
MLGDKLWLIIVIATAIIVLGILAIVLAMTRKKKAPPDYYALFVMGIIWFPVGLAIDNTVFWVLGLIFATIGILNKDKWKKNRRHWKDMEKIEKAIIFGIMIILFLLVIFGIIALLLVDKGVL